jgi:hypothetical protein
MVWDIFRVKRRKKRDGPEDDLQMAINSIERFAPKRYVQEREIYYYNYGQIGRYLKPLLPLLIYISEKAGKEENEEIFVQDLFRKLKSFYDINDRLSIKEALQDNGLKIKLLEIFKIFYNDNTPTRARIEDYLKAMGQE